MQRRSLPLALSIAFPVAMVAYLAAVGYRFDTPDTILAFGLFAAFGFVCGLAVRSGVRVAVGLSVPALAVVPWLGPLGLGPWFVSLYAVLVATLFVCVGAVVLIALEYAIRNPRRVVGDTSPRMILASVLVGIGHLLAVVAVAVAAGESIPSVSELAAGQLSEYGMLGLTLVGVVLLGTIPALCFARFRLVSPTVVVVGGFAFAVYRTHRYVRDVVHPGASPSPVVSYAVLWFVPLAVVIVAAALEYAVRSPETSGPASSWLPK